MRRPRAQGRPGPVGHPRRCLPLIGGEAGFTLQAGFTLIEVMIALAILAGGMVVLLRATAANVMSAQRAQMLTAATTLARGKMYDLEEVLVTEGFQEMDQEEQGDFGEEGWKQIEWKATIVKIELPDMSTLQGMGATGEEGAEGQAAASPLGGGLLGMLGGGGTTAAEQGQEAMGAGIMGTYFQIISDVLKDAIRKITLTVTYPIVPNGTEELVVTYYVTDPAAVNKKIPFAGGAEEEEGEGTGTGTTGTGTETGTGTGTGTRTPTPTPTPSGGGTRR